MDASSKRKAGPSEAANMPIAFNDLKHQQGRIRDRIDRAIARVLDHGIYIMGPEVEELERTLADFAGAKHAIACSSGTDALLIALMALGVGRGDAVICPGFTFTATPEAIALLGATPVFADVDEATFNLDPRSLEAALDAARQHGLEPRVILAVDLFGQPADYDAILPFAQAHGLLVLADGAQSFGATTRGRKVGTLGLATATSFFPAKPLGCYGDGGAIFTGDDELADAMRSVRLHGRGAGKYDIVRVGINGRLDTVQAAILLEKLRIFPEEIGLRQTVAGTYSDGLSDAAHVPRVPEGLTSVWAQYTLRVPGGRRDGVARTLEGQGIPSGVYYPRSLNRQTAYRGFPVATGGIPVCERLPGEVLSLPMHPYLTEADQGRVIAAVARALRAKASEPPLSSSSPSDGRGV
ncbi:MAG TPA: DegT/DnrJ/EryC1/StrS family aminotransferase [Hyphomicrobiaceae bacterium]|nr:DegT/DnrJ/EryC1/StrS family aminotransferase [Hyphomicrobiaceae bacterium]